MKKKLLLLFMALFFTSCEGYGELLEFNGGELYYTSNVTLAEANKLGKYCVKEGFFDGNEKTIQLDKEGSTYLFRMVVKKGIENDQEFINIAKVTAAELSQNVFNGKQVDIHLCDENLKTLRVVVSLQ
tara:strand:+ start:36 stop:419 length:384 start_codon:yes stop_codon:yes gene_type:complete